MTCTVTQEIEHDDYIVVDVLYHMSDNKPLTAEFQLCNTKNQDEFTECASRYTVKKKIILIKQKKSHNFFTFYLENNAARE